MHLGNRRVVALSLGDDQVASSRVRIGAALQAIQADGWTAHRVAATSTAWQLRFLIKLVISRPDVTVVQKVVPPAWFSRLVSSLSRRLVFECDDAVHLGYGGDEKSAATHSRRLRSLLPLCDSVITSNALLAEDLERLGARMTTVFPGPSPKALSRTTTSSGGVLWLGSPSTIENVRKVVYPALRRLPSDVSLMVVGSDKDCTSGRVIERVWSIDRQRLALARSAVGVAPQKQDEWGSRKALFKVLEYLAAGVVPVVPAVAAARTLFGEEIDILATVVREDTPEAWATAIRQALSKEIDEHWISARDRVFERWSAERLGRVMIG